MSRSGKRRVCVIPGTLQLLAILAAIFYAAASNNNGAAYLLAFALIGLLCISIIQGLRNLHGLSVRVIDVADGFATSGETPGETARARIALHLAGSEPRYGLRVELPDYPGEVATVATLIPDAMEEAPVHLPPLPRGVYRVEALVVSSLFPFGFFRIQRRFTLSPQEFAIYPAPFIGAPLPAEMTVAAAEGGIKPGGDDFVGVRNYQEGESQRHVDWKAVSRGHPMMIKQFGGGSGRTLLLEWSQTEGSVEERLGVLAWWAQELERHGHRYGLTLPHVGLAPGQGALHLQQFMRMLAGAPGAQTKAPGAHAKWFLWKGGRA